MRKDTIEKIASRLDNLSPKDVRQLFLKLAAEKGLLQEVFDSLRAPLCEPCRLHYLQPSLA